MAKHRVRDKDTDEVMAESDDLYEDVSSGGVLDVGSYDTDCIPLILAKQWNRATTAIVCISVMTQRQVMASWMRVSSDSRESDFHDTECVEVTQNNDSRSQANLQYQERHRPKPAPPPPTLTHANAGPLAHFYYFFYNSVCKFSSNETEIHSSSFKHRNLSPEARAKKWTNFILSEISGFVACLLNMNIIRQLTIASYWLTSPSQNSSWFSNMFTGNRLHLNLNFFLI
jgi:hypothetical protein